jgi:PAS domain S-box-containing protein
VLSGEHVAVDPSRLETSVWEALFAEPTAARCLAREDGHIVRQNTEWSRYVARLDLRALPVDVPLRGATTAELRIAPWARGVSEIPPHRPGPGPGPTWEGSLTWVFEAGTRMALVSLHEVRRDGDVPLRGQRAHNDIQGELRLGEERLRQTLEYARAGIFEWDLVTGKVYWSPEQFELYGVPRSVAPDYDLWRRRVHPEDVQRVEQTVQDAVFGAAPSYETEFRVLRSEGGFRWLYSAGSVFRNEDGRPLTMRGLNIDITPRKEMELQLRKNEAALEESERRYRTLAEHAPDIVARFDRHFRYLYVNRRAKAAYGLTPEQLLGRSKAELGFPPREVELWHSKFEKVFATGEPQDLEFTHSYGGEERHYEARIAPELAEDGSVSSLVSVTRDVTPWKKAELELREVDRGRSDFIAVLSHELRNPLAAIRNSLVLLERAAQGGEAHTRAQQVLARQTEQISRLVDDLLDIGRLTHGKIVLQLRRLDAREVVRASCDAVRRIFEDRGVVLDHEESTQPAWVEADRERLAQMVGNLLNNALKFTQPGGRVTIRVSPLEHDCEVMVRDTGAGIPPSDLERIFEPFVQGTGAELAHGGMGVGLSLVKELATRHGGTVRVSSQGHGQGAEFVIALPRAEPPEVIADHEASRSQPKPVTVFLVEDNEDSAWALADLLGLDGHAVEIFPEPAAALEALHERRPDLLICDIGLPGMTGYEFIRRVRRLERGPPLFAVAMTGYAQPADRLKAFEAGFDEHLPKPPSFDELSRVLARASEIGIEAEAR